MGQDQKGEGEQYTWDKISRGRVNTIVGPRAAGEDEHCRWSKGSRGEIVNTTDEPSLEERLNAIVMKQEGRW